jgi:large subunit ribosomal protein L21
MSYTIIRTGGKQFPVTSGDTLRVPTIDAEVGESIEIETLVSGSSLEPGTVKATVLSHGRGDKIIVFKKKRRKQYKRKQGHRQGFTEIRID